ncbi:DUF1573 domain-containing protein [Neolewinella lacunae]|uniref:DUF1573 domain-containing protein n=1 Tax=Neolewinella lacunae TaxID=1517758 RepID=A0A923PPX0_9BACT|nr:DUF1573 domain-containing protein [Neolewinella lacunae]MBC6995238.1 DUF1573 domain-containing protein [Neolewinella lacunae]MDN3635453.1 DUF1573 domain-containing protein [Neolewinella lacunae]
MRITTLLALLALLFSCSPAPADAPNDLDPAELGPNAAIIRNPVDDGTGVTDTATVARLAFATPEFQFGEVPVGEVVSHDFHFTNTGRVPLLITNARSTCGCTVAAYPETPIAPGDSSVISVNFDTKGKYGRQRKPITITANTYPATTTIYVDGTVINE